MSLDPNKTYLVWNGNEFPNSTNAQFKAPAGSTIDWGDGTVETFDTASTAVNTHTYTDGKTEHTIVISGLTSIGDVWFDSCSGLTSVMIGNSVTSIGNGAFWTCSKLTSVTIPNSVTSIGRIAFSYCSRLTSIIIPDSVTSIGSGAFYFCDNLIQLVLFPETPPTLASDSIPNNIQSIYVQQSSKAVYQAATNWTAFATKIVSDNLYLSFVRFNQKNKEYINEKISEFTPSSSINVVQTTGNSETDVMSQRAVTENFLRCPNGLPTETSLVTVSSTGTPAYKKVSEFVDTTSTQTITGKKTWGTKSSSFYTIAEISPNGVLVESGGNDPNVQVSPEVYNSFLFSSNAITQFTKYAGSALEYSSSFIFPTYHSQGENYYFSTAPSSAPTEPSFIVTAADRTPTWQSAAPILSNYVDDTLLGG